MISSKTGAAAAIATLALAVGFAPPSFAQVTPDTTAALTGEVQGAMSGEPVPGAVVFLRIAGRGAVTDSSGVFRIDSIPPGTDTLVVRYPGFDIQSAVLEFESQQEVSAVFLLAERIFQVADIRVDIKERLSPDERARERRRRTGQGVIITREEMLEVATDRPSDALRNIPRVEVTPYRFGGQQVLIGTGTAACPPVYVVDGTRMRDGFELDDVKIDAIQLIEVFRSPAEIPTRYRGDTNRCGLIAITIRGGPG